ncbi:DUF6884 domain-containing protein [Bacillus vallismortis]|uniref:DUF6884 domain-containing protein n=1 Tax=Bacillus vallismortis TaxID=72361 RepID=A0AAP3CJ76_BACVA|nr:DUF6884 domain-containing protein [Bacillus vallismortis]MCY8309651.1 hypothetical protein [Bacillus vallismortis]MCY8317291.1 hypothetical protein [Bacillus vallismortis]MCY8597943.1 hypothetical protein [Bacillus vallismortis]MEC1792035.1 hypothetical protein [Bacillus vallismortis]
MKRLCIIPCGKKKIWDIYPDNGPTRAKDAYLSPFHQACERYAKVFFDEWVILSAKHGFLRPDDIVSGNYDVTFGTGHPEIMTTEELRRQFCERGFSDIEELVMLGGKKYRSVLNNVTGEHQRISWPLSSYKGIGYMLQALNRAVEEKQEL